MPDKPKLSVYWAAACGGCEIAIVNIHEKILEVDAAFDFFFCPCLLDTKKKDVEALPDGGLALTLFNGAIRTEENEEMAHLLRRKSQVLIAFGSCAYEGCVVGLGNLYSARDMLNTIYCESVSTDNPSRVTPRPVTEVPEGTLHIPALLDHVKTLAQVTEVDYFVPGCPPEPHQIAKILDAVMQGSPLPPRGSILGAGRSSVCDECSKTKADKKIARLRRTYELIPDPVSCLLEQGLLCMGIATRDGCGALCPKVNMPCTGCYGPPEGVIDQGAKMVAALGSVLDFGSPKGLTEEVLTRRVEEALEAVPDLAGTFYKYSLADSLLGRKVQ